MWRGQKKFFYDITNRNEKEDDKVGFFNPEGKLFQILNKWFDLFVLNLIFVATCIPIITIGAGMTAMYYVTLKIVKDQESYVFKSYWKSFKQNFKQATAIWLLFLGAFLLFCLDFYFAGKMANPYFKYLFVCLSIFEGLIFCYVFPILSRFENTVKNTIKNAMMMSIRHLPWSILLLFMNLSPVLVGMIPSATVKSILIEFMFLIGFSLIAFLCSWCLAERIFPNYMPEKAENE